MEATVRRATLTLAAAAPALPGAPEGLTGAENVELHVAASDGSAAYLVNGERKPCAAASTSVPRALKWVLTSFAAMHTSGNQERE